jgi:hypothetical protein
MDLKDVIKVVEGHAEDISDIASRVCSIEINRGMVEIQIQNLIKSVDQLIDILKLTFFGALGVGFGFIIWYVQGL